MALYCPKLGFYEKEKDRIGRRGEFFTSVSVGKMFGELLAFQFGEWLGPADESGLAAKPEESGFHLVEAGADGGDLACDILRWLQQRRPEIFDAIEYCIVEPSERQRQRQQAVLAEFKGKVRWFRTIPEPGRISGIIFSNELLDAMPVRRLSWERSSREWMEWGVGYNAGEFHWKPMPLAESANRFWVSRVRPEVLEVLPDGFIIDVCAEAEDWWRSAGRSLRRGRLVGIDYGFTVEELLAPERSNGTLRAYREHHVSADVLAAPGEQDLTAHINFTALQDCGESEGLKTELFTTQERFLGGIFSRAHTSAGNEFNWDAGEIRQIQTLTNPEHLGRSFRVLLQRRP